MTARITPLAAADAPALVAHLERHGRTSGRDGELIFRPRAAEEPLDPALVVRLEEGLRLPVGASGWLRAWGLWIDDALRGHVDLRGGVLRSDQHRATVTIGLEASARRQGWGRRLMGAAIDFARSRRLAWIDLGVFAHNAPARALYASLGFVEVGTTRDRFRVDGQSIDDVAMVLRLERLLE